MGSVAVVPELRFGIELFFETEDDLVGEDPADLARRIEEVAEHGRPVEGGEAEPVNRAVRRDQRPGVAVGEERVVSEQREGAGIPEAGDPRVLVTPGYPLLPGGCTVVVTADNPALQLARPARQPDPATTITSEG